MPPFFRYLLKGRAHPLHPKQLCKEVAFASRLSTWTADLGEGQVSAAGGHGEDKRGISHPAPHGVLWIAL